MLVSIYVSVLRHAQITQKNKFSISLQHLKKEGSNEFILLHTDNHKVSYKLIL